LQKLGYQDGRNIRIEFRNAEGKGERLAEFAAELVRLKVDVLVVRLTQAIHAAKQATREIPIVMVSAADPVGTGLIASLARPGGNITGTSSTTSETSSKILEFVREVLPRAKRVAVLVNANDPFSKLFLAQIQSAGQKAGVEILPAMIRATGDMDKAFPDFVKHRAEFIIVQPSLPLKRAAELALKHRLPAIAPNANFPTEDGGLMAYSSMAGESQRDAAGYVDKILKGAKPADLPVQQPTQFELVLNAKTAKALGIKFPQSLLRRADRVIE
jgi:putative ABC transport system substrate-binding protein